MPVTFKRDDELEKKLEEFATFPDLAVDGLSDQKKDVSHLKGKKDE